MAIETDADLAKAQELRQRRLSGWLMAVVVFGLVYAICIASSHTWGLAFGWLPAGSLAAMLGWIAYCAPWLIEAVYLLLELLSALG